MADFHVIKLLFKWT